jgi:hypothetical protein
MEHSSHAQIIRESMEDVPSWVNFQDVRGPQALYTVTFNGQVYQGLEAGQIVEGLKMALDNNPRVDMSIVLEGGEGDQAQAQLPA